MKNIEVLNKNNQFRRVYHQGASQVRGTVVVYYVKNKAQGVRFGITTSKKIGNAVARNRAKRLVKEGFRLLLQEGVYTGLAPQFRTGVDLVFVARKKTTFSHMESVKKDLRVALSKSGVFV